MLLPSEPTTHGRTEREVNKGVSSCLSLKGKTQFITYLGTRYLAWLTLLIGEVMGWIYSSMIGSPLNPHLLQQNFAALGGIELRVDRNEIAIEQC
jgi:hypothetical protein